MYVHILYKQCSGECRNEMGDAMKSADTSITGLNTFRILDFAYSKLFSSSIFTSVCLSTGVTVFSEMGLLFKD